MPVPASYAPHATASYTSPNRDRVYTWTLFGPSGTAPDPVPVFRLAGPPRVAFGEASAPEFGGGLIAHSADYTFREGADVLDTLLDDAEAGEYLCRITGPDGHGGTYTVWTRPMQGETQGSASPLVVRGATSGLGTHDGLAVLGDIEGVPLSVVGRTLAYALNRVWLALPGIPVGGWFDIRAAWPILAATGGASGRVGDLRLTAEIAGEPERGTYGTIQDQLRTLCLAGTLSVYQPTDLPPDEPGWEIVPRSRVGVAEPGTLVEAVGDGGDSTSTATVLPDRTEVLPPFEVDTNQTGRRSVRRVGTIRLDGDTPIAYATPAGGFAVTERVPLGTFGPTPGLRFAVNVPDPGEGDLRLVLTASSDGTLYYGPDWSTSEQSMAFGGETTTADLPEAGALDVRLVPELLGTETDFDAGTVALVDGAGDPVSDFVLVYGEPGGAAVTLPRLADLEARPSGGAWYAPTGWSGVVSGGPHGSVASASVAERAAQQGADLRALVVTVRGLYGPQARFTLTGSASGNARSPFPEDVTLIPIAGEPDLETGYTSLVLVSAAEL